jgi:hypothetical protein
VEVIRNNVIRKIIQTNDRLVELDIFKRMDVSIDSTIVSGLSENNIVLSETLPNSSVEVVAFTSDTEPDSAPWIN